MNSETPQVSDDGTRSQSQQRVVLVSGPSGAGRSTAINRLEDLGFESIDNLPLTLVPRLLDGGAGAQPLALGIDVRNRDFSANAMIDLIDSLTRLPGVSLEVLYLECSVDRLLARFSETRRRHPLFPGETPLVGIEAELDLLAPIRARADLLINTSDLSPHELGAEVARWFDRGGGPVLAVSVQSFSYKRGLPRGVDMVFDCRFLRNPHWQPELRARDGRDPAVAAHVGEDARHRPFLDTVLDLMRLLLPAQLEEGKSHLSVAFGCTGGKHRSVVLAEQVSVALAQDGWQVSKRHRELERQGVVGAAEAWAGLGS